MKSIYGMTRNELIGYFLSIGEKKYRAEQVFEWLYRKRVSSYNDMSNIKEETLEILNKTFPLENISFVKKEESVGVKKYLVELYDKNRVEAVLMEHNYGNSLCLSTQVGCNMGCSFCESGKLKSIRNLEAFEMVLQILEIEKLESIRVSHVVLMGIGEPFDNYENIIKFINIINDPKGIAIGSRHITVSTCGIIPKILDFAKEGLQVNLAISLHASNDELRSKIMPINKAYNISSLIDAVKEYLNITNRRVTFEYVMIDGVNDKETHAYELAKLLRGINCYVNLIPYNSTSNCEYKRSKRDSINKFCDILKKEKISVTIRKEFGEIVSAACGQLRASDRR